MLRQLLLAGGCCAVAAAIPTAGSSTRLLLLREQLQPVLDVQARKYNTSYSLGVVVGGGEPLALVSGVADRATGAPMTPQAQIPLGSATKMYTAILLLQLAQNKTLDLDQPVHAIVDPYLKRHNGTTLLELWRGDATINAVTTRQLIGMQAGFRDYDDAQLKAFTINPATSHTDVTPYDFLHQLNKTFLFTPGNGTDYSSTGIMLAGLAYAAATNASSWESVDQLVIASPELRRKVAGGITFMGRGLCSSHEGVAHQYTTVMDHSGSAYWETVRFADLFDTSCLNGWTCGNIAAAPSQLARMVHHLFSPSVPPSQRLLSADSLAQMQSWHPFTGSFATGYLYGLGLMTYDIAELSGCKAAKDCPPTNYTTLVGHAGQDYGSGAPLHHYNAMLDMSVVLAVNTDSGANCSGLLVAEQMENEAMCEVYATALRVLTNGTMTMPCRTIATSASQMQVVATENDTRGPSSTMFTALAGKRRSQQRRGTTAGVGTAVAAAAGAGAGPPICVSDEVCSGSSATLATGDCLGWKELMFTTNGSGWKLQPPATLVDTRTVFNDPCSCDGHVTCQVVSGQRRITAISLANASLAGFLPPGLGQRLGKLTALVLSGNVGLSESVLPALPFAQYTHGCALDGIGFNCPLPAGVETCHRAGVPALAAGKSDGCLNPQPPLSLTCELDFFKVYTDPGFVSAATALQRDFESDLASPLVQGCVMTAISRPNRTCSVDLSWPASDVQAAQAAASAVVPPSAGKVKLCSAATVVSIAYGPMPLRLMLGRTQWLPIPARCSYADRVHLLGLFTNASSPLSGWAWEEDECATGSRSSSHRSSSSGGGSAAALAQAQQAFLPDGGEATMMSAEASETLPVQIATAAVVGAAVAAGSGEEALPATSEQCVLDILKLFNSPQFMATLGKLESAGTMKAVAPALEKCEISLLLTGKCTAKVDWRSLSNQLATASAAASHVLGGSGAEMCLIDMVGTSVNSDPTSKHSLLRFEITGGRAAWPIPGSCTTVDRARILQWLSEGNFEMLFEGAANGVQTFLTFTNTTCATQTTPAPSKLVSH